MPGYMQPCRHCDQLVPPDSEACPFCGKWNPLGDFRCPKCRSPVKEDWKLCANCGLRLVTICNACGKDTFFGDYCQHCGSRLTVKCQQRRCGFEQPPLGPLCAKCGKPISGGKK